MTTLVSIPQLILVLSIAAAHCCRPSRAFAAFVHNLDPTTVRTKPLNMTRKAATPPRAAWIQMTDMTQEWDVDRYQNQHSFVWEYGTSLVDLVFDEDFTAITQSDTTTNLRILDVGCGSGELTAQLAERSQGQVTGLDADLNMVQAASEQYPHLTFVHADVRDFDLGESTFDVVFSNAALHWVPPNDVNRAISCLGRAMRPGGKLVVEFGGHGNVQTIVKAIQQQLGVPSPWYFPTIADFTTRLETVTGVETTMACLYDRPTPLKDGPDGLRNWLRMFGNKFWQDLPDDDRRLDEILANVEDQVRPLLWDGETWYADYRRLRVVGQKL